MGIIGLGPLVDFGNKMIDLYFRRKDKMDSIRNELVANLSEYKKTADNIHAGYRHIVMNGIPKDNNMTWGQINYGESAALSEYRGKAINLFKQIDEDEILEIDCKKLGVEFKHISEAYINNDENDFYVQLQNIKSYCAELIKKIKKE